jgi:hypothetical protein
MKQLLIFLLFCLFSNIAFAQEKVELSGQVKDVQTKKALEFASIVIKNEKDSIASTAVTDDKGYFTVLLNQGNYSLIISFIGYKTDTVKGINVQGTKFLGVIKLEPNGKLLQEVTVSARSNQNLLDRDVQIVTEKLKTGASNTTDVLEKINGISYDRINNAIKVDNNDKVIILVDGLEKDQEYIKNISPDRLQKIEIIRDPGGRYGLEGYSAVINVILKKDYQGTDVYVSEFSIIIPTVAKLENAPMVNNIYASFNYVYNKLDFYSNYDNDYNNMNFESTRKKDYNNGLEIDENALDKNGTNTQIKEFSNRYTVGADYTINPKQTISFESNLVMQPQGANTTNQYYNVIYTQDGNVMQNFNSKINKTNGDLESNNKLFYQQKFDENNILTANFNYSIINTKYTNELLEDYVNNTSEDGKNNKNLSKLYVEYVHTFSNKTILQGGYGNTYEKFNDNYNVDSLNSQFSYSDMRNKFYAYYSWERSKIFSFKIGAAEEIASIDANQQQKTYLIYQPYADIKLVPFKLIDFKLKYRVESIYPTIAQTNPFVTVVDQNSVSIGNPNLSPAVINKVSLEINILKGLLSIEPYFHFSDNYITQIGTLQPNNIFEINYNNVGSYKTYGVKPRLTIPLFKGMIFQTDLNYYNSSIEYAGKTNEIGNLLMSGQLLYQNEKTKTVTGLRYQRDLEKSITAEGYNEDGSDLWYFFIQQSFFKQKLSATLIYIIPMKLGIDYYRTIYTGTDLYKESEQLNFNFVKNAILLNISYRFNEGKSATKTDKNIDQDDNSSNQKKGFF